MAKVWGWISSNLLTSTGRGRLYKAGVGLFGLLAVLGVITADESVQWTETLTRVLAFITSLVALLNLTPDTDDAADEDVEDAPAGSE